MVAGAGTGKTSCVVGKIGYLFKQKLLIPSEILALAFNKDATNEMKRVKKENW